MQKIVARASNRVFVGVPLCAYLSFAGIERVLRTPRAPLTVCLGRKQDYLDLAIRFTMDVVKDRTILIFFPHFLRPYVRPDLLCLRLYSHFGEIPAQPCGQAH